MHSESILQRVSSIVFFTLFAPLAAFINFVIWFSKPSTIPFSPKDKIIIITGASSGIGEALAYKYAKENAILILIARRSDELKAVGMACTSFGAKQVHCEILDVSNESAIKTCIQRIGTRYGLIDMIVLNAGISMGDSISTLSPTGNQTLRRLMDINFFGATAVTLHALPFLKKSIRGRVVVVSSLLGLAAGPLRYCASKFALKGFFECLRVEEPGLDVIMIYPGVVNTGINRTRIGNKGSLDLTKGMSADDAASLIVDAVIGRRDEAFTFAGNLLWFMKDLFPHLRDEIFSMELRRYTKGSAK